VQVQRVQECGRERRRESERVRECEREKRKEKNE
jgi:hypothetical protein